MRLATQRIGCNGRSLKPAMAGDTCISKYLTHESARNRTYRGHGNTEQAIFVLTLINFGKPSYTGSQLKIQIRTGIWSFEFNISKRVVEII